MATSCADIVVAAAELISGSAPPSEPALDRFRDVLWSVRGVADVRRVRVHRGQRDDAAGRFRRTARTLHRVRLPATGEALDIELACPADPEWAGEEQAWLLHSTLTLVAGASAATVNTAPVEQLLWNTRAAVVQLERDRWTIRSAAASRILGYTADITRHQEPLSFVDPQDRPAALRAYVETLTGRTPHQTIDLRVLGADGAYVVVEARFVNLPGGSGRRSVAIYGLDVTARRADEARLHELFLRLNGAVLLVDETGYVRMANEAFTRMFGSRAGHWAGEHQREALRAVVAACVDDEVARHQLATFVRARKYRVARLDLADGRVVDLDRTPLVRRGLELGALWQFREVTGEIAPPGDTPAGAAIERQNRVLATVSHELRTPLTAVVSFAEMLEDPATGDLSDAQRAATEVIARNTRRLLTLVDDLLLLSRLETSRLPLRRSSLDVPALVSTAVTDRQFEAEEAEIELICDLADGPPLTGDASRLTQVIDNLIRNAMKFSARGSTVRVSAHHEEAAWTIRVTDAGMGIPASDLERITTGFERGANAVAAGIAGSGLGLAICRELVELHGGTLAIASTVNVGTEVTVTLPAERGE